MAKLAYDWLPDRHLGVASTLAHADELVGQVGALLFDYQSQPGEIFSLKEVRAGSYSRTVVASISPIPRKVPLLVADAMVALRAAIEHVLFSEVEHLEGAPINEKAARLIEMPAFDTYEKFDLWTKARVRNGPPSLQPGSELVRRIGGLQPFHRRRDPELHPLSRLVLHTNHAKHRTPAITAVRLPTMYRDDQPPRSPIEIPQRPEEPLRVGEVLAELPWGTRVAMTLVPTVGINRPGTDRWPVLMVELEEICEWVRTQAIPRLITGLEPPEPALPAHYDISVGYDDERSAISAGSTRPAVERHREQVVAAVARVDLARVIGGLRSAPGHDVIAAWLAGLTDAEVVARGFQVRFNPAGDSEIEQHNCDVIARLRDEAVLFARGLDLH